MENKSNRSIVLEAYKYIIGQCNTALVNTYISDTYVQHSPTVKDGKEGLVEMIEFLKKIPRSGEPKSPIVRTISDGNFVMVHLDVTFMNKRMAVVDIFRVHDGLIAEHWDAVQESPEFLPGAITMTNGATLIEQEGNSAENKLITEKFCEALLSKRDVAAAGKFLHRGYIEHAKENLAAEGNNATFLQQRTECHSIKVHRILGEGNFTVVQFEGIKEEKPFVFYDIFRVEDDTIAEHWSVVQAIPAVMAHTNGMM